MAAFFLVSGGDDFLRRKRAREIAAELGVAEEGDDPGAEIIAGDAADAKPEVVAGRFLDSLRTPPFLSPAKLIWLRPFPDLEFFSSDREPVYAEILSLLSAPLPPDVGVLIEGPGLDQRKSWVKGLKTAGATIEFCNAPKSSDRNFAESRRVSIDGIVRRAGKRIEPAAVQFLAETVGGSSGNLANELEKVLLYIGDASDITLDACRAVVSRTPETISWEFTSAVVAGDVPRALRLLNTLLDQGEVELRLIAGLSGEFQRFSQTRSAMAELKVSRPSPRSFDGMPEEARRRFPNNPLLKMHPYRAFKTCEAAMRFGGAALAAKLELIRNASRALVSGGGESRIIMEQLVLKLAGSPGRR